MMNPTSNGHISSLFDEKPTQKTNGYFEPPTTAIPKLPSKPPHRTSSPIVHPTTVPNHTDTSANTTSNIKPLMTDTHENSTIDAFDEFRRMAALIHQEFNAPYSKVINATSAPSSKNDATSHMNGTDKNSKTSSIRPDYKTAATGTFAKSWKIEHTAGKIHNTFIYKKISISYFFFSTEFSMYDT